MLNRLESAFDRQRQFTADASHELRTPLTIVDLETARALDHRRTVDEYERALHVIRSENDFMTHLVNNLLTLARMDSGRAVIKPEEIDLSDLAVEVMERLEPLAREKGVELQARDLPETIILGDRQYLTQMLSNLVENAIKIPRGPRARTSAWRQARAKMAPEEWAGSKLRTTAPGSLRRPSRTCSIASTG